MLLAAADAEDAPSRHTMLVTAAAAVQVAAAPLTGARAAWDTYFGEQGAGRAAEIVAADGLAALQKNATVRRKGYRTSLTNAESSLESS